MREKIARILIEFFSCLKPFFQKENDDSDIALDTSIHHVTVIGDDSAIVSIAFANVIADPTINFVGPILHISRKGCPCGQHTLIQGLTTSEWNQNQKMLKLCITHSMGHF